MRFSVFQCFLFINPVWALALVILIFCINHMYEDSSIQWKILIMLVNVYEKKHISMNHSAFCSKYRRQLLHKILLIWFFTESNKNWVATLNIRLIFKCLGIGEAADFQMAYSFCRIKNSACRYRSIQPHFAFLFINMMIPILF